MGAVTDGEPLRWFEELYASAGVGRASVPWADLEVNIHLASWDLLDPAAMCRVLVVGCGYGDDAEWLSAQGCQVTAFDISPTAVTACRRRFPTSQVDYQVADLLELPDEWTRRPYDLVVEAYTIQVLPPASPERAAAVQALVALTARTLLVIARGRDEDDDADAMPWPLSAGELRPLQELGLQQRRFDDYLDHETPPVRRFRATYTR